LVKKFSLPLLFALGLYAQKVTPTYSSASGLTSLTVDDGQGHVTNIVANPYYSIETQSIVTQNGGAASGYGDTDCGGTNRSFTLSTATWLSTCPDAGGVKISTQYSTDGVSSFTISNTVTNPPGSGVVVLGTSVVPLQFSFPRTPTNAGPTTFAFTTDPLMNVVPENWPRWNADWGTGRVMPVDLDPSEPLYYGFRSRSRNPQTPDLLLATLLPAGNVSTAQEPYNRTVNPGQSDTFTVVLRFGPSGTPLKTLAGDAYQAWAKYDPAVSAVTNFPHGAPTSVYLSAAPGGNANRPGGCGANSNNPRNYSVSGFTGCGTSVLTPEFRKAILSTAISARKVCLSMYHCPGPIVWDIEGQEYPQDTSYVCSPAEVATLAPEMEQQVTDSDLQDVGLPAATYHNMKLDDAFFAVFTNAGLKVGGCLRPQSFVVNPDGSATRQWLSNADAITHLNNEMAGTQRWGGWSMAYIDTFVNAHGGNLPPSVLQSVANAYPQTLFYPEEHVVADYAFGAPFSNLQFNKTFGTNEIDPDARDVYPRARTLILINNTDPNTLASDRATLTQDVHSGDDLMTMGYNKDAINQIYGDAQAATALQLFL
jgi:hypothetical protein